MKNFRSFAVAALAAMLLCSMASLAPSIVAQKMPGGGGMPGRGGGGGVPPSRKGQGPFAESNTDAFNLGPIGARASIRGSSFVVVDIMKKAPADGLLEKDDELTGVNGKKFEGDPRLPLGEAINLAEQTGKTGGKLTLTVKRGGGEEKPVEIKLPQIGSYGKTWPFDDAKSDAILTAACDWLAKHQAGGQWTSDMANHQSQVAVTCMAGLALLGSGISKYDANCKAVADWMKTNAGPGPDRGFDRGGGGGGGGNWNQENWSWGYAGIYLGEYYLVTGDQSVLEKLKEICDALVKNQEKSGGWAHGPGGPNALGYVELNVVAYHALIAMALAKECGVKVDDEAIARGQDYIEKSSKRGSVGYSERPGQNGGAEPGRTGGTIVAYKLLNNRQPVLEVMTAFLCARFRDTHEGHASQMVQITFATLGLAIGDAKGFRDHMDYHKWLFDLARLPDGSFSPQPNHETLQMGSNSDRNLGYNWTTGAYALCYAIGKGKLRIGGGAKKSANKKKGKEKEDKKQEKVTTGEKKKSGKPEKTDEPGSEETDSVEVPGPKPQRPSRSKTADDEETAEGSAEAPKPERPSRNKPKKNGDDVSGIMDE